MNHTNNSTMKLIGTFLFFFGYLITFGQTTFSVSVTPYICDEFTPYLAASNITVHRNDQLIYAVPPDSTLEFILPKITEGEYKFHFTNSQGKPVVSSLYLSPETREILLCINQVDSSNTVSMTRSLRPGDYLFVEYISAGCFNYEENWLKFYFHKNRLYGELWENGEKVSTRRLNASKRAYLAKFEQDLRLRANIWGGCTTSEMFTFVLNGDTQRTFIDNTCTWGGYYSLKKKIFKKK